MADARPAGDARNILFEKSLQAEVIAIESDMLKCEIRSALVLQPGGCEECDGQALYAEKHKNKYVAAIKAETTDDDGVTVISWKDPREACYEDHNCVDKATKKATHAQIIYIAKPYALRTTSFDNKTLKINEGEDDEFSITYKYDDTGRKRTLTYSKETERCTRGAHEEVIWPAYRQRVGKPGGDNFVPGDMIWYIENTVSPDISADMNIIPKDKNLKKDDLAYPDNPGAEALFCIDINLDSRKWSDDCGKGGGGGGGGVWV